MASMMTVSAKPTKPEGARTVLKAAREFNQIILKAPVTVELVDDASHAGYIVYHSRTKNQLKVYSKGNDLVISLQDGIKDNEATVTSRVVICCSTAVNKLTVNGSGTVLSRSLTTTEDVKYTVNGSGDIKVGEVQTSGSFDGCVNGSGDLDIHTLTASKNISLVVNGSGDLDVKTATTDKSATLAVNGSGDLDIDHLQCKAVSASLNGSGDLDVKGTATKAILAMTGAGDLKAGSLQADDVTVSASGSGDLHCRAAKSLSVNVHNNCDVHVHGGRPAKFTTNNEKSVRF
jgi:hypothetical protein